MTIAEELRQDAELALKDGGMYYSGEYLSGMASRAEKENAELRDVCADAYKAIFKMYSRIDGEWNYGDAGSDPVYGPILRRMLELGIGRDDA